MRFQEPLRRVVASPPGRGGSARRTRAPTGRASSPDADLPRDVASPDRAPDMLVGIGTDIFRIARMRAEIRDHGREFAERIFTSSEIDSCESRRYPARHYAARFAAKEALLKALPPDRVDGAVWREIEILNDRRGMPRIVLHGAMKELAARRRVSGIFVSLSHTSDVAAASVVVESSGAGASRRRKGGSA